jgi:hypothetical protein
VIGRYDARWASVAAISFAFALACSDGASRWILKEAERSAMDPPGVDDAGAPDAGEPDAGAPDAGEPGVDDAGAPDAGDAAISSDAASDAAAALPDPELFASVCAPQVAIDNRTASGRGALFDEAFPEPDDALLQAAKQVCALLYKVPDEVPMSPPIVLVIEDFYGIGEIGITAPVIYIRLSSLHMQSVAAAGDSVREAVEGSLHYLLAIDYELDDENPAAVRWVTEGIAFWVRYRAGYASHAERRAGGAPTDDYKTTGFFFEWLDRTYPDAVYLLNQSLDPADDVAWSEDVFEQITGKDLATLWSDYQASL